MPRFGEYEVLPSHETAVAYGLDVLTLCNDVGNRVCLVAQNYSAVAPDIAANHVATGELSIVPAHFRVAIDARRKTLEQMSADMPKRLSERPIETAVNGIHALAYVFRAHTLFAHEIFQGYTPVHTNPDWPKSLVRSYPEDTDRRIIEYGYHTEPLIAFAREMAVIEGERFAVYNKLFIAALKRDKFEFQPPAFRRFPLLN